MRSYLARLSVHAVALSALAGVSVAYLYVEANARRPAADAISHSFPRIGSVPKAPTPRQDVLTGGPRMRLHELRRPVQPVAQYAIRGGKAPVGNINVNVARLNWRGLAACESGGNPRSVSRNGRYHGLYQFALSTWRAVGGRGTPTQWSAAEQTYRAQLLYKRVQGRWQGQWPVCGRHLFR